MTKKTKEAIKATSAIVIAVFAILIFWIFPLIQAGKFISRPDELAEPANLEETGFNCDSLSIDSEDNLMIKGYFCTTQAESARGVVLLIHGLSEGISSQQEKTKALLEAGYNVIAYDQRGYGQTGGDYRSGGFMEGNDLQSLISRLDLEERITKPLIIWGEEHGATGALRAWIDEDRIDYMIAVEPVVDGRDWQKRIVAQENLMAPDLYLPIIWWWMNQKSSYSISLDESDISDQFGILTERYPDKLLIIAKGENDTPQNSYLSELRALGGEWMIMKRGEGLLIENNKDVIIEQINNWTETNTEQ